MRCTKVPVLQLANVLSTEALFYACIFPFIAFFGSFAFVLYPLRDVLHPTGMTALPLDPVLHKCLLQCEHGSRPMVAGFMRPILGE